MRSDRRGRSARDTGGGRGETTHRSGAHAAATTPLADDCWRCRRRSPLAAGDRLRKAGAQGWPGPSKATSREDRLSWTASLPRRRLRHIRGRGRRRRTPAPACLVGRHVAAERLGHPGPADSAIRVRRRPVSAGSSHCPASASRSTLRHRLVTRKCEIHPHFEECELSGRSWPDFSHASERAWDRTLPGGGNRRCERRETEVAPTLRE